MPLSGSESPSAAFLAGAQHGAQLAVQHHAAAAKPAAVPTAKPVAKQAAPKPQTLNDIARQNAQSDTTATVNTIQQQQQQAQADAMQRAGQIQLASQAGAQFLTGVGDQTAKSYSDAAQQLAGLASGFSGDLKATATNAASDVAKNLAVLGAPTGPGQGVIGATQAQVAAQPQNLANIMFNQGGFAPANLLETSGQAFAAAQRQLPASTLAYGNQQAQGTLGQGAAQAKALAQQIIDAQAGQPKLAQQYLASLQSQLTSQQSLEATQALAKSLMGSRATSGKVLVAKLNWQMQQGTISNQIKQFNADTARFKAQHPGAAAAAGQAAAGSKPSSSITKSINDGYLHSADGQKVILNGNPVRVATTAKPPKGPTVTAQKQQAEAYGAARHYHVPWKDAAGKTQPPLRWSAWLTAGLTKGISAATLIQQGRRIYTPDEIKNDSQPGYTPGG